MNTFPIDELRELLRYEADGTLIWRPRGVELFRDGGNTAEHSAAKWNSIFAGRPALHSVNQVTGYRRGTIHRRWFLAHRVVFAMHHGGWPDAGLHVDHVNRVRDDNRIENLRLATPSENAINKGGHRDAASRFIGVHRNKGRWSAQVKIGEKVFYCGRFDDEEDAARARDAVALRIQGPRAFLNFPQEITS